MGKDQELLQAVQEQDVASVEKILLKHRSSKKIIGSVKRLNVNQQDGDGMTVLHHAVLLGNSEILKLLMDHGALFDVQDGKGMRPLHYAAWQGHDRPMDVLLQKGASVNEAAFDGNTPLHLACEHGHFDVVNKLLQCTADATVTDNQHRTPLDLACEFGRTAVVERLLESESCCRLLRDTSSDMADNSRTTCLHLAARNGHVDIIGMLLEAGIDINRQTLQGTCLHEAAKYGKTDVVRLLLSCGIDVTRLNSYEQTALELVNKYTTTRAARELKQLLKDASVEMHVQPVRDPASSGCQSFIPFSEGSIMMDHSSSGTSGGMRKGNRNGLDGTSTGHIGSFPGNVLTVVDPSSHKLGQQRGKSFHWNHSSPQPPHVELAAFGGPVISNESFPPPPSPLAKSKTSSQELNPSGGLLIHLIGHRSSGLQPSVGQMNGNRQNRLSGQSCESGVSGISSSRQSYHSSSSSQGSLEHMEESGYSSTVNVHELLEQGLSDTDILHTWLSNLHLEELTSLFLDAGYDMPTISRMTPEDLTAIGITKPSIRKKLKLEISKLSISDGIPDHRPKDVADWLNSLHMESYLDTLVKQGYSTLDTVTDITWEDLEEIGIKKLGHQKKMMLAIDRLKRINSLLHRLSNSGQPSTEGVNHLDPFGSGGKLLPRVPSSISTSSSSSSSSSSSVSPVSTQHHATPYEILCSKPWKSVTKENCSNLNEQQILMVERLGTLGLTDSVEIHSVPPNRRSPCFPISHLTSINHNTYPALPDSFSRSGTGFQMDTGALLGKSEVLDGDATPTNERKLITNSDQYGKDSKVSSRIKGSQEEPVDFYLAEQNSAKQNGFSSYSTLPKKLSCKRKMTGFDDSYSFGFPDSLHLEDVAVSSFPTQVNRDVNNSPSFEQRAPAQSVLMKQKKEPPLPPKRSDSFKTNFRSALGISGDRLKQGSHMSFSASISQNCRAEMSESLPVAPSNNLTDSENNSVIHSVLSNANRVSSSASSSSTASPEECPQNSQKQLTPGRASDRSTNPDGSWQDNRTNEGSDDSDSGLESRHSASSASLESNGSGGAADSNTLPFANENVGTIKQRNPSTKPSILATCNGASSELNLSLFNSGNATARTNNRTNNEKFKNESAPGLQFTLVNGEIVRDLMVNNGNLPVGANSDSVFNDIDGMLNGLTQELDEMLKLHG